MTEALCQGFTQKIDVIRDGSWATRFGLGLNMTATCVAVFLIEQFVNGRPPATYATIIRTGHPISVKFGFGFI